MNFPLRPLVISCVVLGLLGGCERAEDKTHGASLPSAALAPHADTLSHQQTLARVHWPINSIESFNGMAFSVEGDVQVVPSPWGQALAFDGDRDRLLIDANPFAQVGLTSDASINAPVAGESFTVEVLIKPNIAPKTAREPRFFHIEDAQNPQRRLTLELRLDAAGNWWMDSFIKSEQGSLVLIDPSLTHPAERWAHLAVTYADGVLKSFVNGKLELSGEVDFLPIAATAKTSIGGRMNQVNWYDGAISDVMVTNQAVSPADFVLLRKLEAIAN